MQPLLLRQAADLLYAGGVIAYPTEGVFGLGCLPDDRVAVERIFAIKGRSASAGLILIAAEPALLADWIDPTPAEAQRLQNRNDQPVTWIVTAAAHTPVWLTGGRDTLAVRITDHPVAAALTRAAGSALVSTSANRSGRPPARTTLQARRWLGTDVDMVVPGALLGLIAAAASQAGIREVAPVRLAIEPAPDNGEKRLYIVQLDEPPALALHKQARLNVTASAVDRSIGRFDPQDSRVDRYVRGLRARQNYLLTSVAATQEPLYNYGYTFNGMAVELTERQAEKLRLRKGIANVWEDRPRKVSTSDSPRFLGLLDNDGGLRNDLGLQGEGVIIGIIDSGIAPGHPSFADREQARDIPRLCRSEWAEASLLGIFLCRKYTRRELTYDPPPESWNGACETGEGWDADDCNNKLIGARFYREGFNFFSAVDVDEFNSPADADGHGTHIASIAAGNVVDADVFGRSAGTISGVAPRARVAVYKACWLEPEAFRATCSVADLQAAIEDAVADGVDVISFSIGNLDFSINDPDDLALLAASDAGIPAITPTGNDGPDPYKILSPATTPWVVSVGATSRAGSRVAEGLRVNKPESIADDYEIREAGFTPKLSERGPITADVVLANDGEVITPEGEQGTVYDACSPPENGDELNGNIALVQRGGCDFDDKLRLVQDAGAVAMLVQNNDIVLPVMDGSSTFADIPAVIIGQADGQLIRDRLQADDTVEITLDKSIFITFNENGDELGVFSSRGPSLGDPNFLKPDLVAPGVRILGAQTPDVANGFRGEQFQYLSGTSQSVPHVAGLAALIKEARPDWTPAEIKSAMMTSARQDIVREDGSTPADPFDMGAGHIVPNDTIDPGLLYDISTAEYDSYLCTVGLPRLLDEQCAALVEQGLELDAQDLNLPSVAITELAATETITRKVRNPAAAAVTLTAEVVQPEGITVTVDPISLTLGPGDTADYTVRFDADVSTLDFDPDAGILDQWRFGSVSWVNDQTRVYTPFAVRPAELGIDAEFYAPGSPGSLTTTVRFGYSGDYAAVPVGLAEPCVLPDNTLDDEICTNTTTATVGDDRLNSYEFLADPPNSVERFFLDVPFTPGSQNLVLRVALFDEETDGIDDLDIYLYRCADEDDNGECAAEEFEEVGFSQNDLTSEEIITYLYPESGTYILDVHGYETDDVTGGPGAEFRIYTWLLDSNSDAGNLALAGAPGAATAGESVDIEVSWPLLDDGFWFGGINHTGLGGQSLGITLIEIDSNAFPAE